MHFSIFLRTAMQNCKVTQADLAAQSDVSQGAISRYLNGKASPKAEELLRISRALNTSMEQLLTGSGQQQSQQTATPSESRPIKAAKTEAERLARLLGEAEHSLGEAEHSLSKLRSFLG